MVRDTNEQPTMKTLLLAATIAIFIPNPHVQAAESAAPGAKPVADAIPAKPKPFSSAEKKAFMDAAEGMHFHISMIVPFLTKYKDSDPAMYAWGNKIYQNSKNLFGLGVDMAVARGMDAKLIMQERDKNNNASQKKIGQMSKDVKKWEKEFFDFYAKDAKKCALSAENALKTVQDAELKAWMEKAAAQLKSHSEAVEEKLKEAAAKK
jgi:hypothetical protein